MTSGVRKTHEEFVESVLELTGNEYEVISKYVKASQKLKMKHNICGNAYTVTPNKFLNGRRCQICNTSRKWTTKDFSEYVKNTYQGEYSLLSVYKSSFEKVTMKHENCGYVYDVSPTNFKRGRRCPNCFGVSKKNTEIFKVEVFDLTGEEYTVVGEYLGAVKAIKMFHKTCGKEYLVKPSNFLSGNRCSYCFRNVAKTLEEFEKEVLEFGQGEYEVVGEYINARTKIEIFHFTCNKTYMTVPDSFSRGHRCPNCNESKGEYAIKKWLEENFVKYKKEYKFKDCLGKKPLRFDFAIIEDDKARVLIEFDGKQHFEPSDWLGGEEKMRLTQKHDNIKNDYCKKNNIPLIRIPYWDIDKISIILADEVIPKLNKQCTLAL